MHMNLVKDNTFKVIMVGGECHTLSLENVFKQAPDIFAPQGSIMDVVSDLSLVVACAQDAVGFPANDEEWNGVKSKIIPNTLEYLEEHLEAFDTSGPNPFLQFNKASFFGGRDSWKRCWQLSLERPSNEDGHSHYDRDFRQQRPSDNELAHLILRLQLFDTGGILKKRTPWCSQADHEAILVAEGNVAKAMGKKDKDKARQDVADAVKGATSASRKPKGRKAAP